MYAVIKAGGKQQRVKAGDVIEVELMHHDGDTVELHPILVVDDDGKTHVAKLVGEQKGEKVKVFKFRPKTGYAKRQGHRQLMTLLEIEDIKLGRRAPAKASAKKGAAAKEEASVAEAEPGEPAAEEPQAAE